MHFDIGGNQYRNASNLIEIDGMGHLLFEHNRRYNDMTLRGMLFDRNGNLVARISESSLALNLHGEFDIDVEASVVRVVMRESRDILLEIKFLDTEHVQIHKAKLYTGKGHLLEITPTSWTLGHDSHSGEIKDCVGEPVRLS